MLMLIINLHASYNKYCTRHATTQKTTIIILFVCAERILPSDGADPINSASVAFFLFLFVFACFYTGGHQAKYTRWLDSPLYVNGE
jgi:hypothetical protein